MHITLTETFDEYVDKAISAARANGLEVWFERDGTHGTSDLEILVKFQKAGFAHEITTYKGKYDDQAIRVIFHPIEK